MDCIFCKIITGEIPAYKVFENDDVLAFLDISQATRGHTIITSKQHFKNIYELDRETSAKLFAVVPEIARAIKAAFNPIGLNVLVNTDKPLQSVMHIHIHLIPRYEDDEVKMSFVNHMKDLSKDDFEAIQKKITEKL
jgi:histidine triad (HIT) family protein